MTLPVKNIFERMRGLHTAVTEVRRKVLIEVAQMVAEERLPRYAEKIPYLIIHKHTPTYRDCVFKERAIVKERIRLAFGMDLQEFSAHGPIIDDITPTLVDEKYIQEPIVNIIKIGCERCPEESYFVTSSCLGCMAHPCIHVCPVDAVSMVDNKAFIARDICIKCGKCQQACPYSAIIYRERPCAAACGVDAIFSDKEGFAEIDYSRCVSCGLCIVSCPFGAIGEKSELVQVLHALKKSKKVYAEIAPSFIGQFGKDVKPGQIVAGLKELGFAGIVEVAYGADITVENETRELLEIRKCLEENNCREDRTFVGTSCCPSWVLAAQRNFPELSVNISESYTPMVDSALKIKEVEPEAIVVFIGPCIAKKIECFKPEVHEYVDFVMTFEELAALFEAKKIKLNRLEPAEDINDASSAGRGFPIAGGVTNAILENTKFYLQQEWNCPNTGADTLKDCLKMLRDISNSKISPAPLLVEGMACPHGCVGGPGTLSPLRRAQNDAGKFAREAKWKLPQEHLKDQT